jgi:hypothetical protein
LRPRRSGQIRTTAVPPSAARGGAWRCVIDIHVKVGHNNGEVIIMTSTKSNLKFKIDAEAQTLDEQIIAALEAMNIPVVDLDIDEDGNIFADPDKDPAIYDWAVNG